MEVNGKIAKILIGDRKVKAYYNATDWEGFSAQHDIEDADAFLICRPHGHLSALVELRIDLGEGNVASIILAEGSNND